VTAPPEDEGARHTLTVVRDRHHSGSGLVTSDPAGIDCDKDGQRCSASFVAGTRVTLTATPDSASRFASWQGCDSVEGSSCTLLVDEPREVTVAFDELKHTLSVAKEGPGTVTSTPEGIDCGEACSASFADGNTVSLLAVPETGSSFTGWEGCDSSARTLCYVTLQQSRQVTARFAAQAAPGRVTLSISKDGSGSGRVSSEPAGIDCGSACSASFEEGSSVTVYAEAAAGSSFAGWDAELCADATAPSCTLTLTQSLTLSARFIADAHTLTVEVQGSGTVTSRPSGIDCPGSCSASFDDGTRVTLTATPASGWTFESWGGACAGTQGTTCRVTLEQAEHITARFSRKTHPLRVELSGQGSGQIVSDPSGIDCPGSCEHSYPEGTTVTLEARPSGDSRFGGWREGCDSASGNRCTVTLAQATTIKASFEPPPPKPTTHRLTLSRQGPADRGKVTSEPAGIDCGGTCSADFERGTRVTLHAQASKDGRFDGWGGACAHEKGTRCTVRMDGDLEVSFKFLPKR
jgi:hypothetical protein